VFVWTVLATNGGDSPDQLRRSTLAGSGGTKRQENPETKPELGLTAGVTRATVTQHQVSAADSSGMTLMGGTSISLVERHRGFSPPDPHGFMEAPDTPDLMLWCSITFQAVWFKRQRSTVDLVSRYVVQNALCMPPGKRVVAGYHYPAVAHDAPALERFVHLWLVAITTPFLKPWFHRYEAQPSVGLRKGESGTLGNLNANTLIHSGAVLIMNSTRTAIQSTFAMPARASWVALSSRERVLADFERGSPGSHCLLPSPLSHPPHSFRNSPIGYFVLLRSRVLLGPDLD